MPRTDPKPGRSRSSANPLRWVRELARRPLKLEWRGRQLHVVLGDPRGAESAAAAAKESEGEQLRRGHAELRDAFKRHPDLRHLMRHLAFVERELSRSGKRALQRDVPVRVLERAKVQLQSMMREVHGSGLQLLLDRLEATIAQRSRSGGLHGHPLHGSVDVSEASASVFEEMERSWTGQVPLGGTTPPER